MRRSLPRLLAAALAMLVGMDVGAAGTSTDKDHNRYKWRDGAGNLQYGDALPAEAAKYGYEIINPQGVVVKRVERAKTTSELAAAKAAAATAQIEKNKATTSERADEQLISGYPEEGDLKRTQQQKLEMLDQQIVAAQISLRGQEQVLADLLGRAAEEERNKVALPEAQARQLTKVRKRVDDQRLAVERRQGERQDAIAIFEAEIARYRELKAKLAAQQPGQ
jgi:hypothetical protein